ncbi:MAG: 1-deoxy-D-xylulose-5-phosphate reductoisomerase [Candidatus Omnitrophica bacterium]|nr:1-deoxy-D-xylulose-5-phosphate reductoisomerase [Candidatus Omnitrophota bacterium]
MKNIALLGSTGSVGRNVLEIVRQFPKQFRIKALSSNKNTDLLLDQVAEFKPESVAIGASEEYLTVKKSLGSTVKVYEGTDGMCRLASEKDIDVVFLAVSGTIALPPLIEAIKNGKIIALASKEPIVSAGSYVMPLLAASKARLLPVDSEHSAVMSCIGQRKHSDIETIYLTGSGGSLWHRKENGFLNVTVDEVLSHPKWNMGKKITVDSATLMNKGLEVIEARWLFDITPGSIKVLIHPEAVIHSIVEFKDGTSLANLFMPDMRFPILTALAYPDIYKSDLPKVDLYKIKNLSFFEADRKHFPALELAYEALEKGGTLPAVLNSSNEAAVKLFLSGKINFDKIVGTVEKIMRKHQIVYKPSLKDIMEAESWASGEVLSTCLQP